MVGLTVAGLDYLANCAVYVLDRRTGREVSRSGIRPLHRPRFGDDPGDGALRASAGVGGGRVSIEVDDDEDSTSIRVQARDLQVAARVVRADLWTRYGPI